MQRMKKPHITTLDEVVITRFTSLASLWGPFSFWAQKT